MNREKLITKTALDTIRIEKDTLSLLSASVNNEFIRCVQAIADSKGRLIVTGIGKSALVGQKITATLNSTGTSSAFMHAADAIHGDLGMITPDDLVLCLSKSGETPEVKVLVPLVKNLGNLLIGMVANVDSFLGKQADFVLHTPVDQEADPNNLAPTSSTTAQMVLGDALATALLALKGFSPKDFAQYHPGGALGKKLYLRVADLVARHDAPKVNEKASISEIIVEMTGKRLGATAVLDQNNQLIGIITDGDLRRMLKNNASFDQLNASDIMSRQPKCINEGALAVKAFELMRKHSISQLVVMRNDEYIGMVHMHDLMQEGLI